MSPRIEALGDHGLLEWLDAHRKPVKAP